MRAGAGLALIVTLLSPVKVQTVLKDGMPVPEPQVPNTWQLHRTLDVSLGARMVEGLQLTTGAFIGTLIILIFAIGIRWLQPGGKRYPSYW